MVEILSRPAAACLEVDGRSVAHSYTAVPNELLTNMVAWGLKPIDVCLYAILLQRHDTDPYGYVKHLARQLGVSPMTVRRSIYRLEDAGLVVVEEQKASCGDNNANVYHLQLVVAKAASPSDRDGVSDRQRGPLTGVNPIRKQPGYKTYPSRKTVQMGRPQPPATAEDYYSNWGGREGYERYRQTCDELRRQKE